MELIASVEIRDKRSRDVLIDQINLMGYDPEVVDETVTVTLSGRFIGSFISLIGTMDGAEFSQ